MATAVNQWKDPSFVERWKRKFAERFKGDRLSGKKRPMPELMPLLNGVPLAADVNVRQALELEQAREFVLYENEALCDRAHRIEGKEGRKQLTKRDSAKPITSKQARYSLPDMITRVDVGALSLTDSIRELLDAGAVLSGEFIIQPAVQRAPMAHIQQAKEMFDRGLTVKAQRQISCSVIGGAVPCEKCGRKFIVPYLCHGRYCPVCGPQEANKLFARKLPKLRHVAQQLMQAACGIEGCAECKQAIEKDELPHWPPARQKKNLGVVCATIDFMYKNTGTMPTPDAVRTFNQQIKKFFRALEKQLGISRKDYGFAYCDEFGENNSNLHAHGIYVGPRLPQSKRDGMQLSLLWRKVTGHSFIVTIKKADNFGQALYHAIKYPAKFAERSSPERRAVLETVFHRVRRFHTMGRFYRPDCPEEHKEEVPCCPACGGDFGESAGWETIAAMRLRHLCTVEEFRQAIGKDVVFGARGAPVNT